MSRLEKLTKNCKYIDSLLAQVLPEPKVVFTPASTLGTPLYTTTTGTTIGTWSPSGIITTAGGGMGFYDSATYIKPHGLMGGLTS